MDLTLYAQPIVWKVLCYGILHAIETMAYILATHNSGCFNTKLMGFPLSVINANPYYAIVVFHLHGSGGQVGALNSPWRLQVV